MSTRRRLLDASSKGDAAASSSTKSPSSAFTIVSGSSEGAITSRYLTPHALHAAHAVTGACCVVTACALEGSVAHEMVKMPPGNPRTVWIEHPSGMVDVRLETKGSGPTMDVVCGVLRTARPIMRGEVLVPASAMQPARAMAAE